jgi:hypothetical protein
MPTANPRQLTLFANNNQEAHRNIEITRNYTNPTTQNKTAVWMNLDAPPVGDANS